MTIEQAHICRCRTVVGRGPTTRTILGLSRWQVAAKFGAFLPGGGVGSSDSLSLETPEGSEDRLSVTGPLNIDCMICHHATGSGYSPFARAEQVDAQNFAYAATVATGIATISGNMTRLKDDFDRNAEDAAEKTAQADLRS